MEAGASTVSNGEGFLSRMALNDNKAGMEGLDRDKINKIIMESSKGSRFYENELKKEHQVNQRVERMMLQKAQITEQQLRTAQAQVERMTMDLERGRGLSRVIVHVDMDAFYAAVEMRDCPELKDKPMAVGSMSMLSTSNYHARKFGVRAGMPGFIAKKLCPSLVIVPTNFDKYRAVSTEVRDIFADYDPHFLPMSLDEAYLDITGHLEQRESWPEALRTHHLHTSSTTGAGEGQGELSGEVDREGLSPVLFEDSPSSSPGEVVLFGTCGEEAVRELRFRIEQKTTLTASAGIAPNMMLAKVCSDKNKPNGQYRLPPTRQAVMDFIQALPVRKVSGIGKVTEKMLGALGISSCAHLGQEMALVSLLFSETSWHQFLQISLGLGSTYIERDGERKSMSTERTFGEMSVAEEQLSLCRELCQDLAQDLSKEALKGKTVTLKLKNVNFEVKSRAWTLPCAVATTEEIFAVAKNLLKTEIDNVNPQPLRLRLMGVRISTFVSLDDKKPLQKSIVGFLQLADTSGPSQKSGTELVFKSPAQPQPSGCPPLLKQTQESHGQEEPLWCARQRGVEEGRPGGQQQQSFFQRAQTRRLRLQAERGDAPGDRDGVDSSGCSSTDTQPLKNRVPSTRTQTSTSSAPDMPTTNSSSGPSTKSPAFTSDTDSLTCPVCFREVRTTDLAVFNIHIDQCLCNISTQQNNHPDLDSEPCRYMGQERVINNHPDLDSEPCRYMGQERVIKTDRKECEERPVEKELAERERKGEEGRNSHRMPDSVVPRLSGSCSGVSQPVCSGVTQPVCSGVTQPVCSGVTQPVCSGVTQPVCSGVTQPVDMTAPDLTEANSTRVLSLNTTGLRHNHHDSTPSGAGFEPMRKDSHVLVGPLSSGSPGMMASFHHESHDLRGPVLTCPVCQVTQDTDDLAIFNRHMDLCLNQELLHELGGLASVGRHTLTHSKVKDRHTPLQRSTHKGKSKRHGSSPPPPSKKTKALGPQNTIDRFFR